MFKNIAIITSIIITSVLISLSYFYQSNSFNASSFKESNSFDIFSKDVEANMYIYKLKNGNSFVKDNHNIKFLMKDLNIETFDFEQIESFIFMNSENGTYLVASGDSINIDTCKFFTKNIFVMSSKTPTANELNSISEKGCFTNKNQYALVRLVEPLFNDITDIN